jgi:vacuolar protein sorting-associated protein 51
MTTDGSDSDSSDDEYLTQRSAGATHEGPAVDREALVRKKLLENFYGKSAVASSEQQPSALAAVSDDDDDDDDDGYVSGRRGTTLGRKNSMDVDNIDSVHFDAKSYAVRHIHNDKLHDLLEVEERLALQVRTLDSTMQTLVYENYTKFIDAASAIHNIHTNVTAHAAALQQLQQGMNIVAQKSQSIEQSMGTIRDKVADKIREARLLSRLESLLKLPVTCTFRRSE